MDLPKLLRAIAPLKNKNRIGGHPYAPMVEVSLTRKEYDEIQEVIGHLELADLLNNNKITLAFPKLVQAVQLILAIDGVGDQTNTVKLTTGSRKQLEHALHLAGFEDTSKVSDEDRRRFPELHEDAPPVPNGLKPRAGVEYGCGKHACMKCYEPI